MERLYILAKIDTSKASIAAHGLIPDEEREREIEARRAQGGRRRLEGIPGRSARGSAGLSVLPDADGRLNAER
jgi:hypothetical protein